MNALSSLWNKLSRSKDYRAAFAASVAKRLIPLQIRVLRKQRGPDWSQARLAKESGLSQGVISRAEDPEYGNLTINTLMHIAAGFDCAFVGRFVPFRELGRWYASISDEKLLEVPSFTEELPPMENDVRTGPVRTFGEKCSHIWQHIEQKQMMPFSDEFISSATSKSKGRVPAWMMRDMGEVYGQTTSGLYGIDPQSSPGVGRKVFRIDQSPLFLDALKELPSERKGMDIAKMWSSQPDITQQRIGTR